MRKHILDAGILASLRNPTHAVQTKPEELRLTVGDWCVVGDHVTVNGENFVVVTRDGADVILRRAREVAAPRAHAK